MEQPVIQAQPGGRGTSTGTTNCPPCECGLPTVSVPVLRVEDGAAEHNKGGNNITAATVISDLVLVQAQRASVLGVRTATFLRDVRTVPCNPFKRRLLYLGVYTFKVLVFPAGDEARLAGLCNIEGHTQVEVVHGNLVTVIAVGTALMHETSGFSTSSIHATQYVRARVTCRTRSLSSRL